MVAQVLKKLIETGREKPRGKEGIVKTVNFLRFYFPLRGLRSKSENPQEEGRGRNEMHLFSYLGVPNLCSEREEEGEGLEN